MKKHLIMAMGLLLTVGMTSCGKSQQEVQLSNTGDYDYELMVGNIASRDKVEEGKSYFISTSILNVRSSDDIPSPSDANIVGKLNLNDQVKVINTLDLNDNFVEIEIENSRNKIDSEQRLFVSFKYLNEKRTEYSSNYKGRYYVVQNLATEKLRIYERLCKDGSCPNKMVFETDMVVGEQTKRDKTMMTSVGSYYIIKWEKFYQDYKARYPRWYHDSYPMPPEAGSSWRKWKKKKYMPNGKGNMRGAFGWYAAIVGYKTQNGNMRKDPAGQWTHGTIGWGSDKNEFIEKTRGFAANLFAGPRSHGCSRVANESIAYMNQILPEGTPLIKIYAKEAYADSSLSRYTTQSKEWDYILTKERKGRIGEEAVMSRNVPSSRILERGTAEIDTYPTLIEYTAGEDIGFSRKYKRTGNIYDVNSTNMRGVFYIDTGMTKNYSHPLGLRKSGNYGEIVPSFMKL